MFRMMRNVALAAVLGLGTLASMPVAAQADSFYFGITPHGPRAGVVIDDRRSHHRGGRHWDRGGRHWDRGCSAREAVRKADRMGIRRAHVRSENRNVIRVAGHSRGHRVTVVFAKARGCPIIR